MNQSEQINELATALAKAQGAMEAAAKSSENPHFRSSYADLASVWSACQGPLSDNGLSVVQMTGINEAGEVVLFTTILHASGQWMRGAYPLRPAKNDPQGYGSAISYARRYCLGAAVGVVSEKDDDGHAASHRGGGDHQRDDRRPASPPANGRTQAPPKSAPVEPSKPWPAHVADVAAAAKLPADDITAHVFDWLHAEGYVPSAIGLDAPAHRKAEAVASVFVGEMRDKVRDKVKAFVKSSKVQDAKGGN